MKIVVIGGGPGGYVAALKAAILGAEVTLIEKDALGGTCLNRGCIPTKAYLSCADVHDMIIKGKSFGIEVEGKTTPIFEEMFERKNAIVKQLVGGVGFLCKKRKITVVNGFGKLISNTEVEVTLTDGTKENITTDKVILATGSVPILPPMFNYDKVNVISSDEALDLKTLPKDMVVIGGGVIGCEFGQFYAKLGVEITIVDVADTILPFEDRDVSEVLMKKMKKQNVKLLLGKKVEKVEVNDGRVVCELDTGEKLESEKLLVAIGRKANISNIGLEELGISTENGKIVVDNKMQTNVENIYAIGDIVDTPFLAHVASKEGIVAVENIMGRNSISTYHAVPRCVYTDPEVAAVGITEDAAKAKGIEYKVGKFMFATIGKAMVTGKTEGFVKIIVDSNDKIIGGSIVGPHATDLLAELTLCVHLGVTAKQLGDVIHPHPTLSEALMEAVHDVHNEAVHSY